MGPPHKRQKTLPKTAPVAEITFDFAAREEYLTGFHKRKLARAKHAQEEAAKKEKQEKVEARRMVNYILDSNANHDHRPSTAIQEFTLEISRSA
jgi:hypothetical protein